VAPFSLSITELLGIKASSQAFTPRPNSSGSVTQSKIATSQLRFGTHALVTKLRFDSLLLVVHPFRTACVSSATSTASVLTCFLAFLCKWKESGERIVPLPDKHTVQSRTVPNQRTPSFRCCRNGLRLEGKL
jgi:hypothetical protein